MFGTLFWCFYCWLWTSEYCTGPFRKFSKTRIPEKSGKVTCLAIQKVFNNTHVFERDLSGSFQKLESRKNLEKSHAWPFKRFSATHTFLNGDHWIIPKLKQIFTQTKHNKNLIFLMADIALRYTVKTSFANFHK